MIPRIDLGPVCVTVATMRSALDYTDSFIKDGRHHYFCFCEASLLSSLIRDVRLALALKTAAAVFPDGVALMALARIQGCSLPERIPGPSFLLAACAYGIERRWRHFLYGGAPGVAEKLGARLLQDYPGVIIVGSHSPPFRPLTEVEEQRTREMIESACPDLLWVCLGSPKQEQWCAEHVGKIQVPLMLAVGAAFDFHSGSRPWAPAWMRKIGMEWAYRTVTGGRTTFVRNLRCLTIVGHYIAKLALRVLFNGRALAEQDSTRQKR